MKKIVVMTFCLVLIMLVSVASAFTVNLAWDANLEPDITEYRVYQSEVTGNTSTAWVLIGTTAPATTTFTHTLSNERQTYSWVVTAVDTDGQESGPSNPVVRIKQGPRKVTGVGR